MLTQDNNNSLSSFELFWIQLWLYFYSLILFVSLWKVVDILVEIMFRFKEMRQSLENDCGDVVPGSSGHQRRSRRNMPREPSIGLQDEFKNRYRRRTGNNWSTLYSQPSTETISFKYRWTIDDFANCDKQNNAPKYFDSPEFFPKENPDLRFFLRIFPRGERNQENHENVSLYLHFKLSNKTNEISVHFNCAIVDSGGKKNEDKGLCTVI